MAEKTEKKSGGGQIIKLALVLFAVANVGVAAFVVVPAVLYVFPSSVSV